MTDGTTRGTTADSGPVMPCIELVELVTDFLEGVLEPTVVARLERHLAECDGCSTYIEQFRRTISASGRLDPEAVPDEAVEPLLAVFRATTSENPPA
jgi:anti-sigma factor RsiW